MDYNQKSSLLILGKLPLLQLIKIEIEGKAKVAIINYADLQELEDLEDINEWNRYSI